MKKNVFLVVAPVDNSYRIIKMCSQRWQADDEIFDATHYHGAQGWQVLEVRFDVLKGMVDYIERRNEYRLG